MNAGKKTAVEPIRDLKDIKTIKKILKDKPRDLAIFTLGINTNLRAIDIINVRVSQVYDADNEMVMDELVLTESKTGKKRRISLNPQVKEVLEDLILSQSCSQDDYLFRSRKKNGPLTSTSLSRLVKSWCNAVNLKGNYASHSLRKTWGYHQRVQFGTSIPILMECFNHSTQRQTLDYLCIQPEEIKDVYMNEL
ncbi:MAG: tyrosine-type recombinase/integrase [Desulfobacterales bacterium]|nr:tyrosine-type recombinase/integrase [Desulfobacterales bacterium]